MAAALALLLLALPPTCGALHLQQPSPALRPLRRAAAGAVRRARPPRSDQTSSPSLDELPDAVGSTLFGKQPPTLTLLAPAKINLFLRVTRKREDGFHELASLFQTVSLFDTLDFWAHDRADAPQCSMEVTPNSLGYDMIPTDESNLVMRALQLFAERTGETRRIHCRLHKAIPAQGGLGGGSCDAATALFAANRLAGYPVSQDTLIEWGAELGSDVSFFFSRGSAYCTGRGEIIEPLKQPLPPTVCYLIKPAVGCSTPAVFKALGLEPGQSLDGPDPRVLLEEFQKSVYSATFINDLEPPAFSVLPMLKNLREDLSKFGFQAVMMSGSGSTLFCIGMPLDEVIDTWKDELLAKYDVDIFEELFCRRLEDERLWYTEQPADAELTNIDVY
ncbi:hypothetical protein AB1Y20_002504 [Prymnesium parvum]|uniref:4-(cytidine 5'-diphospho)-2-C-methyl-D-erythritol kinase n=1 Tax=Prymnesium parvum TaxID=97485 RepID=A0AB34JBJ0_PRYPA